MILKLSHSAYSYQEPVRMQNVMTTKMDVLYDWKYIIFGIKLALILKKLFVSEPVYNRKFLKNKMKICGDKVRFPR